MKKFVCFVVAGISGLVLSACAPNQQSSGSSTPQVNDIWKMEDNTGKTLSLVVQKVSIVENSYFLNASIDGKAAFVSFPMIPRSEAFLTTFISSITPATELLNISGFYENEGYLCVSAYPPNLTKYPGEYFQGKVANTRERFGKSNDGQCATILP